MYIFIFGVSFPVKFIGVNRHKSRDLSHHETMDLTAPPQTDAPAML